MSLPAENVKARKHKPHPPSTPDTPTTPAPTVPTPPAENLAHVWKQENRVSSDGETKEVTLPDLQKAAQELQSRFVSVSGTTQLHGLFKYEPFLPNQKVTQDPFDQAALYYSLSSAYHDLEKIGFKIPDILASKHQGKTHPVRAFANDFPDLNAYYSPEEDRLAFGTDEEKWHLAEDADVTVHEMGHMILDHIHPNFGRNPEKDEGGAIHEAFGDTLAALIAEDPELSEDFVAQLGRPESKTDGLRIAKNDLMLSDVSREVHDHGRVYSGFFWSLFETFQTKFGLNKNEAQTLGLRLLLNHAANYATSIPQPKDFVDAVAEGTKALDGEQQLPIPLSEVLAAIHDEAQKRGMLSSASARRPKKKKTEEPPIIYSIRDAKKYYSTNGTIEFVRQSSAPFIGGRMERFQQQYKTAAYGYVEVVGHGLQARQSKTGKVLAVLDADVRPMEAGEIAETVSITPEAALLKAKQNLVDTLLNSENEQLKHNFGAPITQLEKYHYEKLGETAKMLKLCRHVLEKYPNLRPRFVVLEEDKVLSYAFDMGFATFYVNSQTGSVGFENNIYF